MVEALRKSLAGPGPIYVHAEFGPWALPVDGGDAFDLDWRDEDFAIEPADLVAQIPASCPLDVVGNRLAEAGLAMPYGPLMGLPAPGESLDWSIAVAIGLDLPHRLEARYGSWRTWILGARVMLADGTIAKSGSKVVKSVAGYDVHKLMVGARGCLAVLLDVTVRVWPLAAIDLADLLLSPPSQAGSVWVQRTLATDFVEAIDAAGDSLLLADRESATLWADVAPGKSLTRYPNDFVVRSGCGADNLQVVDPVQIRLLRRAKDLLDRERRLNRGCLGVV